MAELLSHIVTEDGIDRRISDVEARAMINRVQDQIGNIDLSNLDLELPTDPEFNSVTAESMSAESMSTETMTANSISTTESISIGTAEMSQDQLATLLDFLGNITSIEGVYF